jgi:hypothetical protein
MAFKAVGPFTHPSAEEDESFPSALFVITKVETTTGPNPYAGKDSLASYSVFKSENAEQNGQKARYSNTFPFDYAPNGGSILTQALTALKTLPEYPGLVDV